MAHIQSAKKLPDRPFDGTSAWSLYLEEMTPVRKRCARSAFRLTTISMQIERTSCAINGGC